MKRLLFMLLALVSSIVAVEVDVCVKTLSADGAADVGRVIAVFEAGTHEWSDIERGVKTSHRGERLKVYTLTLTEREFAGLTNTADTRVRVTQYVNTTKTSAVSRSLTKTATVRE